MSQNGGDNLIVIKDSFYTTGADFKAAMRGVLLYYELATPIEVDIDKWKAEYKVEQGGTEQIVSANDTTNLKADIIYGNKV
jgi:trans-aconitate methyltransferase